MKYQYDDLELPMKRARAKYEYTKELTKSIEIDELVKKYKVEDAALLVDDNSLTKLKGIIDNLVKESAAYQKSEDEQRRLEIEKLDAAKLELRNNKSYTVMRIVRDLSNSYPTNYYDMAPSERADFDMVCAYFKQMYEMLQKEDCFFDEGFGLKPIIEKVKNLVPNYWNCDFKNLVYLVDSTEKWKSRF